MQNKILLRNRHHEGEHWIKVYPLKEESRNGIRIVIIEPTWVLETTESEEVMKIHL